MHALLRTFIVLMTCCYFSFILSFRVSEHTNMNTVFMSNIIMEANIVSTKFLILLYLKSFCTNKELYMKLLV